MKEWIRSFDLFIIIPTGFLLIFSYLFLSSYNTELASIHLRSIVLGIIAYITVSLLPLQNFRRFAASGFVLFVMVLISLLFLGDTRGGATRWLSIGGVGFQPSEFVKIAYVIFIAHLFDSFDRFSWRQFIMSFLSTAVVFVLVALQPDLDNALAFVFVFYLLLFFVVSRIKTFILFSLLCGVSLLAVLPVSWQFLHDYQRQRVLTFLQPSNDPLGSGYHSIQALITVGSGGLSGRGLGNGTQFRNSFLPEHTTDFAFASFAEEFGFTGSILIVAFYICIMLRFAFLAYNSDTRFSYYIYIAICAFIFIHVLTNIGMNLGILPVMGITLPFISFGGSSMISFFILFGIAQSFQSPKFLFSDSEEGNAAINKSLDSRKGLLG